MFFAFSLPRKNLSNPLCLSYTSFSSGRLPWRAPLSRARISAKHSGLAKLASSFPTPYTICAASPSRPSFALHKNYWDSCGGEGMSSTATRPDTNYLLRKLHSLSGIVPVGAFLAEHFWSNSAALVSAAKYDEVSRDLQTLPFRPLVEWAFIFLPMLYHAGYGIYIWIRGKSNVSSYPWVGNWLYTTQRYTGLIAFVYIAWHLYTQRWLTHGKSTYAEVEQFFTNPYFLLFTAIGVLASSFHLGIGIWNFLCKWGLAATVKAQRAAGQLGFVVAFTFSLVGVLILISFRLDWHPFSYYWQK
jgi:succinate dehydrogenase / fumarate reductase cytochrome b subunit